jgi:hypothetical protein
VVRPLYLRHLLGVGVGDLVLRAMGIPLVVAAVTAGGTGLAVRRAIAPEGFVEVLACLVAGGVAYAIGAWFAVVLPDDRRRILGLLRRRS